MTVVSTREAVVSLFLVKVAESINYLKCLSLSNARDMCHNGIYSASYMSGHDLLDLENESFEDNKMRLCRAFVFFKR